MLLHIVYSAFVWTMKAKVISDAQRTSLIIIHHAAAVGFAGGAQSTKPTDWWGKNTRQLWTVSRNEPLEPNGGLHRPQTIGRSIQERGLECLKLLSTVPADEPQRDRVTIKPLWLSIWQKRSNVASVLSVSSTLLPKKLSEIKTLGDRMYESKGLITANLDSRPIRKKHASAKGDLNY